MPNLIPKKYRKKPIAIEAVQFINCDQLMEAFDDLKFHFGNENYYIETLEGRMKFTYGDYIIKGIKGEFYVCKKRHI